MELLIPLDYFSLLVDPDRCIADLFRGEETGFVDSGADGEVIVFGEGLKAEDIGG